MAKKKALQKNNLQGIIVTTVVLVASLGILGASSIARTASLLSGTIATINGENVSKQYFEHNLYEKKRMYQTYGGDSIFYDQTTGESSTVVSSIKESAMNEIISLKIAKQQALARNLSLTSEELAEIETSVTETKAAYTEDDLRISGVSDDIIRETVTDQIYYDKLYEDVTKNFVLDQAEFQASFDEYLAENKAKLTTIGADYIRVESIEDADKVVQLLDGGADFIETIKQYSIDYIAGSEYESTTIQEGAPQEMIDTANGMQEGEVSAPFLIAGQSPEEPNTYCILRVNSITEPDIAALKTEQEATFIDTKKSEMFQAEMDKWTQEAQANMSVNTELFAAMTIKGIEAVNPAGVPTPTPDTSLPELPAQE